MEDEIHTDRFILRRYRDDDVARINECVRDPRIYRNVGKIPPNQTLEDTREFITRTRRNWDTGEAFGFAVTRDEQIVASVGGGTGGVHGPFDVGYWVVPEAWGNGVATEAFSAFVHWLAVEKGKRGVTAGYFTDNPASGRVLSKTGFLPAGRSKYHCLGREALVDCVDMARIA